MISARGITREFGAIVALRDVSFDVRPGECVTITGRSGSGRTTLLRILATLVRPTSGTVTIDGLDVVSELLAVRRRLAFADARCAPAIGLTVSEYLRWTLHTRGGAANIEHTRRVREVLALAGIRSASRVDVLDRAARTLVGQAAALMVRPSVLLFGDPLLPPHGAVRAAWLSCLESHLAEGGVIVAAADEGTELPAVCAREFRLDCGRLAETSRAARRTAHALEPA